MIKKNIIEMIGNTDLLYLERISKKLNNNIYVKVEGNNPFGSIKDRIAIKMIEEAIRNKQINQNATIIEATSGNTGIGLAGVCLYKGLKLITVMPENVSAERIKLLKAYHAKVVLTDKNKGMKGALEKVKEIVSTLDDYYIPSQFTNKINPLTHYETTAKEIANDLKNIYAICAGIGSGGTITGIGRFFKETSPQTLIIGVEPAENAVINHQTKGEHGIEGIGTGFIPQTLNLSFVDKVFPVSTENAKKACEELITEEAFFSGISSGAAFYGVRQLISCADCKNENIAFLAPDAGIKYLSKIGEENE